MTAVQCFIQDVREHQSKGLVLTDAVRRVRFQQPILVGEVLDVIGSWPSSEIELRELQRQV